MRMAANMSRDGALRRARELREALLDHGVRHVSIEIHRGRPGTPNGQWYDDRFVGILSHHTVSRPSSGDTPVLSLCKNGRSGLPGPLCNGYMGYDYVYRIICMGWANHPGRGGPWSLPKGRVPANQGRPYLWGTEFEGGLQPFWDEYQEAMGRANAGIGDWLGVDERSHGEHSTWTSRKIDRLNYSTSEGRAEMKRYVGAAKPKEWDEMATKAEIKQAIRPAVRAEVKRVLTQPTNVDGFTGRISLHNVLARAHNFTRNNYIKTH